MTMRSGKRNC